MPPTSEVRSKFVLNLLN